MSVVSNLVVNVDSSNAVSKLKQVQQGAQATSQAVDKLNTTNDALAASFAKSGKPIQTAANGMRFFTDATGRARKENGQFVTTAEAAAAGLRKQGIAAQQTAGKLNGLRSAVVGLGSAFGGIAAVLGVIQAGRFVFAKTAEVESQTRSLQVLTGSAEKAGQIIKELQDLGAVTPFTSTELIDAAKRLQAFGVEADKVVETTRRLADASGATGAELSGLVTAYGQVQAKGRLQGEELLQFQERGIALQEELRKMYGMTGEEFQKALEKGQISAKAVEVALVNLTNTGGKYANGAIAQSDTLSGRLSTLQDNVDGVAREVGKVLTPALIGILQQLNTSLSETPAFVTDIALAFQYAAGQIAPFLNGLSQMQWFFTNLTPPGWAMQVIGGASERGKSTIRGAASRQRQSTKNSFIGPAAPQMQGPAVPERLRQQKNETPPLMVATGGAPSGGRTSGGASKAASDAKRAADEAAREAQRVADVVRNQEFITKQKGIQTKFAQLIFEAEQAADPIRARQLQTVEALVLAGNETARLLEEETNRTAQLAIARTRQAEAEAIRQEGGLAVLDLQLQQQKNFDEIIAGVTNEIAIEEQLTEKNKAQVLLKQEIAKLQKDGVLITDKQVNAYKNANAELDKTKEKVAAIKQQQEMLDNLYDGIAGTIAGGVGGAIDAISGNVDNLGETLQSLASDILKAVGKMLIFYALAQAFGALGGDDGVGVFSFLAKAFGGGRASGGPVAPNTNYIVGENGPELLSMGGSGGKVYSNNDSKMQLAMSRYSRGARGEGVIAGSGGGTEGGGGAAAAGPMVVDVRYSVERINDVEYVTASAFQAGMRQAAQQGAAQGEQRTLRRLQQSPGTRKRVGM